MTCIRLSLLAWLTPMAVLSAHDSVWVKLTPSLPIIPSFQLWPLAREPPPAPRLTPTFPVAARPTSSASHTDQSSSPASWLPSSSRSADAPGSVSARGSRLKRVPPRRMLPTPYRLKNNRGGAEFCAGMFFFASGAERAYVVIIRSVKSSLSLI